MTRPSAPMVPATAELLGSRRDAWRGPAVSVPTGQELVMLGRMVPAGDHPLDAAMWWCAGVDSCETGTGTADMFALDLRRPEARHRFCDVRKWAAPRLGGEHLRDDAVSLIVSGGARVASSCERTVAEWNRGWSECLHVPALASLPDTDTLAWALWECWRVMGGGE